MPAFHTGEYITRPAVGLLGMSAGGTFPGGIPGIDVDHRNTCEFRLVFDELRQLGECPAVMRGPLLLPDRRPCADAREFLKGEGAVRAFGFSNDALADYVVHMCGKSHFPPVPFLQETLRRLRSLRLELLPYASVPGTDREKVVRREVLPCGQCGYVHYPPVDTDDVHVTSPRARDRRRRPGISTHVAAFRGVRSRGLLVVAGALYLAAFLLKPEERKGSGTAPASATAT